MKLQNCISFWFQFSLLMNSHFLNIHLPKQTRVMNDTRLEIPPPDQNRADQTGNFGTREVFLRKVYTLFVVDLILMFSVMSPFLYHQRLRRFLLTDNNLDHLLFGSILCILLILCILSYLPTTFPCDFFLLQGLVLCIGVLVGVDSTRFPLYSVYLALLETLLLIALLTLFVMLKPIDPRLYYLYILVTGFLAMIALLICVILHFVFPTKQFYSIATLVISAVFMVYFCAHFLYTTQVILKQRRAATSQVRVVLVVTSLLLCVPFMITCALRFHDNTR